MRRTERIRLIKRVINPSSYRDYPGLRLYASVIYAAFRDVMFVGVPAGHTRATDARSAVRYLEGVNCEYDCDQLDIERDGLVGHFLRLVGSPTLESALDKLNPLN